MDDLSDHERAIAWCWVIESLATFKEVDASLLHDLVEMAPALPGDMGKNAKERVALKCLEGLFGPLNVMTSDVPSTQHSKISFDFSESCQTVLRRIFDETPESDLRMAGPGLLRWDIHPFIMHKRASLPKCALKQVKDSILDGTHPHADFLRIKSGLTLGSDGDRVPVNDSNWRLNKRRSNAQNTGVEGNSGPLILEKESKLLEDPNNENLLPSKRDRIALDTENMEDANRNSINDSDNWHIKAKKMKCDASYVLQSIEKNQIHVHGRELLEDSSERDVPVSERERCDLSENQMLMVEEGQVLEDGHDDYTASNKCGQSSHDAIQKRQSENHSFATSMPANMFRDVSHKYSCVDEAKDDGGLHPEPRTSGVAPSDETQHKVSAKVFNCNSIKVLHPASTYGPQQKSIADEGNGLDIENPVDENCNSVIDSDDSRINAKKMRWNAFSVLQSIEQNQIPLHGRELLVDSSERDVPLLERERCDLAENKMGMMEERRVLEDGHDDYTSSKRCGQSTDNAIHKTQSENPCNATSMPQDTFQDVVHQCSCVVETKDDGGLHPEPRASGVAAPDETQHKISAKVFNRNSEHDFHIKVQHPASEDGPQRKSIADEGKDRSEHCPEPRTTGIAPADETKNKDSAKESDCSSEHHSYIKVARPVSADGSHCKGVADKAKELGDCHCESETTTDSDEFHDDKIDVAMKKHAFLSSQCTSNHDSSETTDWTEKNLCMKCNEEVLICNTSNCPVVVHENWLRSSAISYEKGNFYCPFCSYSRDLTEYLDAKKEASLLKKDLAAFICTVGHQPKELLGRLHSKDNNCTRNFDEALLEKRHQNALLGEREENQGNQCEEHVNEASDLQFQNIIGNEQQVASSVSCFDINPDCRDKGATAFRRKPYVSAGEKEEEEKVVQECISVGGLDGCPNQVPVEGDNLSSKNIDSFLVAQGQSDAATEQEDLKQYIPYAIPIQSLKEPLHKLTIASLGTPQDDDTKSNTSNYSLRIRSRKIPNAYPETPQFRRGKVPWTVEEEEMLKKGVETFSSNDERNIWKKILEFGDSVFLKSRTPVDLKDKWRNLCKGSLKLK